MLRFREQEAKINEQTATIAVLEESLEDLKRTSAATAESSFATAPVRMLAQAGKMLADQFLSSDQQECDVCETCDDTPADTDLPTTSHADKS